ncbi:hypothetical protein TWF696_004925 [Orbilia brochopaga]|uniref:Uncharacterized protein n=1 Tax=Orbilia brochopaga TaxID=3140254 RepID=A0AAV9UZ64_9PEZI
MAPILTKALLGLLPGLATAYSIGWGTWDELTSIDYTPVPKIDRANPPCNAIPNPPGDTLEIFVRAAWYETLPYYIAIYGVPPTPEEACSPDTVEAIYAFDFFSNREMQGAWVSSPDAAYWQEIWPNYGPSTPVHELINYFELRHPQILVPMPDAPGPIKWGVAEETVYTAPWDYVPPPGSRIFSGSEGNGMDMVDKLPMIGGGSVAGGMGGGTGISLQNVQNVQDDEMYQADQGMGDEAQIYDQTFGQNMPDYDWEY